MKRTLITIAICSAVLIGGTALISWRKKAANLAGQFIDIAEIGNNQGFSNRVFEQMMRSIGWKDGEAWCMYFVKSIYLEAFPKKASDIEKILTGSTQQSWKNAMNRPDVFKVITNGSPQKGDIVIWQSTKNPTLGHAGIVDNRDNGPIWVVVEGNSSLNGGREGSGGVAKHTRKLIPGTVEGSLRLLGFLRLKTSIF